MTNKIKSTVLMSILGMIFVVPAAHAQERDHDHGGGGQQVHAAHAAVAHAPQVSHAAVQHRAVQAHTAQTHTIQRQAIPSQPHVARHINISPRINAQRAATPVVHNTFLHRQHHGGWHPRYNYYQNGYHFYPYVNVTSVVDLSPNDTSLVVGDDTYYYDQGAFYEQDDQGYVAVPPPVGAIVASLPAEATQVVVNGQVYFLYNGVYYQPVAQGYQVVEPVA